MHLIGDMHQPLHTVALFGGDWPNGDKGGNAFFIRAREGGAVINLHQFWDGLLGNDQKYRGAGNLAIELRNRPEFAREKLGELNATEAPLWCDESVNLAREVAYLDGTLNGGKDRTAGPVLPDGYAKQAKAVAERRVVVAGYRLAETLTAVTAKK
jgi:hypothetical protein